MLKQILRPFFLWFRVVYGLIIFSFLKRTPQSSYQALIGLFCLTGGKSNDLLSKIIAKFRKPYKLGDTMGILGRLDESKRRNILLKLNQDGYYVFEKILPEFVCDSLLQFATTQPASIRPMDGESNKKSLSICYDRNTPQAIRYDFSTQDLLSNTDIQNLLTDISLISIAQDYLGSKPSLDVLSMWWHTSFSDKPDKEAAQFFHFDMDRIKWLKIFIYITDVSTNNGPHTFVAGSHKTGGIPERFLEKGYSRLDDEDVFKNYGMENIIEFSAPKGTIIIEDTRGLHKGKHVAEKDRLILQLQYSNSLFGGYYPKANFGTNQTPKLKEMIKKYKSIYSAYLN